jgi:hypothetical protein
MTPIAIGVFLSPPERKLIPTERPTSSHWKGDTLTSAKAIRPRLLLNHGRSKAIRVYRASDLYRSTSNFLRSFSVQLDARLATR